MTTVDPTGDIATIMLPGHLDSATSMTVERMLVAAMLPRGKMIVDGSAVAYMSAAGVRALATALHAAEAVQAHVVFCRFSGPAADCLEVSGFAQLLDVVGSLEEARARLVARTVERFAERLHGRRAAG
jgi:anti-sigma B factor antagonist